MITGDTGSFGNAALNHFLCTYIGEFCIFSRDKKKQDNMCHEYQVKYPDVTHIYLHSRNCLIISAAQISYSH